MDNGYLPNVPPPTVSICDRWTLSHERSRPDRYRNQFRGAAGALNGADGILGRESSHQERAFAVGRHQDGSAVEALNVLSYVEAATVYFNQELRVDHVQLS